MTLEAGGRQVDVLEGSTHLSRLAEAAGMSLQVAGRELDMLGAGTTYSRLAGALA
ncbi:MAG: hypothetical protein ACHQ7M_13945 [Chloroflexota bacterium]|jgi:hypothetical protein